MQNYNYNNYPQFPGMTNPNQMVNQNRYAFVNGIEGAKAYQILPNTTMLLMDSDSPLTYMKTSDMSGRSSLRIFKLVEITEAELKQPPQPANLYASLEDVESLKKKYDDISSKLDTLLSKSSKREPKEV